MGYNYDRTAAAPQPDSKTLQMAMVAMKDVVYGFEDAAELQVSILRRINGLERPMSYVYSFIQDVGDEKVRENLRKLWLGIKNATEVPDKFEAAVQLAKVLKDAQRAAEAAERDAAMWAQHRSR